MISKEQLQSVVEQLPGIDERMDSVEQLFTSKLPELHYGLNVRTDVSWFSLKPHHLTQTKTTSINYSEEELHSKKITLMPLHEFLESDHPQKQEILRKMHEQEKKNYFDHIHHALAHQDIIIIPEHSTLEKPLIIQHVVDDNTYQHTHIFAEKNSHATMMIHTIAPQMTPETMLITDCCSIYADESSQLNVVTHREGSIQNTIYSNNDIHLESHAQCTHTTIDHDAKLVLSQHHAKLVGDGSQSTINTIAYGDTQSQYDYSVISEHVGRNTNSLIQGKGILLNAKSIMRGLVKIQDTAFNSNGYQKSDYLLVGEQSRAIAIPDLEIHNDQVKCTHGATITRPDKEKLFYLQSRGLSKEESEHLMIAGFYDKLIQEIPDEEIKIQLRESFIEHS